MKSIVIFLAISAAMLAACKPTYHVSLKVNNQSGKKVYIKYVNLLSKDTVFRVVYSTSSFDLLRYDRPGVDLEWGDIFKSNIVSIMRDDSVYAWKDYNIEGAWETQQKSSSTNAILTLEPGDF